MIGVTNGLQRNATSWARKSADQVNSASAQLAEKNDDRHARNKIEGVNRARGGVGKTIHHLFMAKLKGYLAHDVYRYYRGRYKQCTKMLNGLKKKRKQYLLESSRRWTSD